MLFAASDQNFQFSRTFCWQGSLCGCSLTWLETASDITCCFGATQTVAKAVVGETLRRGRYKFQMVAISLISAQNCEDDIDRLFVV
jgi:hypothetical protein